MARIDRFGAVPALGVPMSDPSQPPTVEDLVNSDLMSDRVSAEVEAQLVELEARRELAAHPALAAEIDALRDEVRRVGDRVAEVVELVKRLFAPVDEGQ